MSSDPLVPVWARLDCEPAVFFADRADPTFEGCRDPLVARGFLREIEPAGVALCQACGGGHLRPVVWLEPRTGAKKAYIPCPNCGSVEIDPSALRRWAVAIPEVLAAVFRAAGGRAA